VGVPDAIGSSIVNKKGHSRFPEVPFFFVLK
jgi:hypothetical protein